MNEHRLGRRPSPDPLDNGFLMRRILAAPGTPLPTKKTWPIRPGALDQGATGTCVGHGWANWLRCLPIQTNKDIDQLRWQIYDAATKLDIWPDNDNDTDRQMGTSVRAAAEALMTMGRLKSFVWAFELQSALEWILTKSSIVLGVNWYSSFGRPDAEGIVRITPTARIEGGHAFLWRGATTSRGLALCSNSWGDDWGKSGEFLLPFRDLERLIHEDGECCAAIEQKLRPKTMLPPAPQGVLV